MEQLLNEIKMELSEIKRTIDLKMKNSQLYYQIDKLWEKFMIFFDKAINVSYSSDLESRIEELEKDLEEYEEFGYPSEIEDLIDEKESLERDVAILEKEQDLSDDKIYKLNKEIDDLTRWNKALSDELEKIRNEVAINEEKNK